MLIITFLHRYRIARDDNRFVGAIAVVAFRAVMKPQRVAAFTN
jgi:hypothetical protein